MSSESRCLNKDHTKSGSKTKKSPRVDILNIVNLRIIGDNEKEKATRNLKILSFNIDFAIKYEVKMLKIPRNVEVISIVEGISIPAH